ncbi:hypothetical protein Syun_029942 [Stephania yunnanensis]|uniref:Membrane-bound O-acyltransferase C24H6.01c n=1 Tax=Stephania yunnanensis TaxID=152371 RepID=A0AAP0EE47_9MAGN
MTLKGVELMLLVLYALVFYAIVIHRSLQLSHRYSEKLYGLRAGWIGDRLNDVSDAQWRNFRGNLPVLTTVFVVFSLVAYTLRPTFRLNGRGMSIVWSFISFAYLSYLHGAWSSCGLFSCSILWICCVALRMNDAATEKSLQIDKYSFMMYLCYLVYAPLYIAGPIVSFNAFASQLDTPQKNFSLRSVAWYGLRWALSFCLMEMITHWFYYNAFVISGLWKYLSPLEVFIIGYGSKFYVAEISVDMALFPVLVIGIFWNVGGVEVPENMPKCINNCYNLESFWKNWHASFNKWLVRYMYIPLGGSKKKLLNVWVIFTFVAIWHDLEWKLLSWAWLTCLFFVPELIVKSAVAKFQVNNACGKFILREFGAVSGAITISCLMVVDLVELVERESTKMGLANALRHDSIALPSQHSIQQDEVGSSLEKTEKGIAGGKKVANLVGYVIGPSGINWFITRFLQKDGLPVLGGMFTTFYVGTKLMFHIREAFPDEKR